MTELITMPTVVADTTEAVLERWLVKEGDQVYIGDPLAEIETEKATVEYEAEVAGVISRLLVDAGSTVSVGGPIAVLTGPDEADTDIEELLADVSKRRPEEEGDADQEEAASSAETKVLSGQFAKPAPGTAALNDGSQARRFSSPLARRRAREYGIDISDLPGSGPGGRLLRRDVEAVIDVPASSQPRGKVSSVSAAERQRPEDTTAASHWDEPVSGMRRAIARRLTESKATAPHFYLSADVRMDSLLNLRSEINISLEPSGHHVTVNDLLLKALGSALAQVPAANVVWLGDTIRRFDTVDIATAMATSKGLVAPVIRNVADRSLSSIVDTTADLKRRAAEGRIYQHELEGGSFSMSNLGMHGTKEFSAIINSPHAGIVAIGATEQRPVVEDGQLTVSQVMTVTLSADHRVIDGIVGAELMGVFARRLENPLSMLL